MDLLFTVIWIAVAAQVLFCFQMFRNYRYVMRKFARKRLGYRPKTCLIVPCKGLDEQFQKNITAFYQLDYENYLLYFVVEDTADTAYPVLEKLKAELSGSSAALEVKILTAGRTTSCSQKLHNLLYAYNDIPADVEILAFADSDACPLPKWLAHLVYPLRQKKNGASTGYRWFIPEKNNLASLALSAVNAKVAQLLGSSHFNQAWGGSMAIRTETFRKVGLDEIWKTALSDDLTLSRAVKKAGLKVFFVPGCLAGSYQSTDWKSLFEFARRQFLITRVITPGVWLFGLISSLYSVAGMWGGLALAAWAIITNAQKTWLFILLPAVFVLGHLWRTYLRQAMVKKLLSDNAKRLKSAAVADILASALWSWILLICIIASGFGRTIIWRGVKYKLVSPTQTEVIRTYPNNSVVMRSSEKFEPKPKR